MTTKIADIIVPEVFNPYIIEKTAELSNLVKSGIIEPDPAIDILARSGGKLINMPFYKDLGSDDEVLDDESGLTPEAIGTGKDVAVLFMRGKAWGVNDLAKALSGDDPMRAIGDLVAEFWSRAQQKLLLSILKGVFAADAAGKGEADANDHIYDATGIAGNEGIKAEHVIAASAKMGDAMQMLTAMMVHSAVYAELQKQNLIDFEPTNEQNIGFGTYLNKTIIVDDGCPVDSGTGKYTTYLFGRGAIGYGEGAAPVPTETDRDSLAGEEYLINRRHFILHPRGVAFQNASIAGSSPTNDEVEVADEWAQVYESKNVRLVKLITKLEDSTG